MKCNFACPYCFEKKNDAVMDNETMKSLVKFVEKRLCMKADKMNVVWFGGEPLLAKNVMWDLSEGFLKICNEKGIEYSSFMVSNAYLLNEDIVDKLIRYKINNVQVTIDGPREIHNQRRYIKYDNAIDTFTKIIKNVKLIYNKGIIPKIRVNIDKTNVEYVEELFKTLEKEGLSKVKISIGQVLSITDECGDFIDKCLSVKEFSKQTNNIYKQLKKYNFTLFDDYPFYPLPKDNYCGADQINSFVIQPNGDIFKCWDDISAKPIGNVKDGINNYKGKLFEMSKWMLTSPFDDKECRKCKYLPICMGGCPYLRKRLGKHVCEKWKYGLKDTIKNMVS